MMARLAADVIVILQLLYIVVVVLGGLLVLRWPRAAWLHLPAAAWGVVIERKRCQAQQIKDRETNVYCLAPPH